MFKFFEALTIFDWLTPTIGFWEDWKNDPTPFGSNSWTFFVSYDSSIGRGWNAFDIEKMLNQHGVKTWGGQITNGEYFFSVKRDQARWAEYLLTRYGVPVSEKYLGAPASVNEKPQTTFTNHLEQPGMSLQKHPTVWGVLGKLVTGLMRGK